MGQWEAMISHWLGEDAADDQESFALQVAKAEWLEKRHFEFMGQVMGGSR